MINAAAESGKNLQSKFIDSLDSYTQQHRARHGEHQRVVIGGESAGERLDLGSGDCARSRRS